MTRGTGMRERATPRPPCLVDRCPRAAERTGMCGSHARKVLRNGHTGGVSRTVRNWEGDPLAPYLVDTPSRPPKPLEMNWVELRAAATRNVSLADDEFALTRAEFIRIRGLAC